MTMLGMAIRAFMPTRRRDDPIDRPGSSGERFLQERLGRKPVQWVVVRVTEGYIHCSKHIPLMIPGSRVRHWGTDNPRHKGGDYFGVAAVRP